MAQEAITKCYGLITQFNPLAVQQGALIVADNCNIRRENIIENRRGYGVYGSLGSAPKQALLYRNTTIFHNGTSLSYDSGSGSYSNYSGTYSAPTGRLMRSETAATNLYITTSAGVKVLTDVAGTAARLAGAPRALDLSYTLTGATGFLANNFQCAYRATIERTDANGNVLTGYPSQRLYVTNSAGGSRNVILTMYLPAECIAGDVIKFYRTDQVSGVASDLSGDEMALVFSYQLVAGDITAGFVTSTDSIVDALRGETLYTSPSQQGQGQANDRPPLCEDIALYASTFMFYAATQSRQRLFLTLVGTSGLSGKTITLAGTTYNFGATEIISGGGSPQAQVSATGTAAVDIDLTARSLVRVINRYASNTSVYAYYLSGSDELPGQILIEARTLGTSAFTANGSDSTIGGMFNPVLPVSPATSSAATSSNDVFYNGLMYAKDGEFEHVPSLNIFRVGPANTKIRRILALRDSLIILKEEGVYRLTGADPNSFAITPLDLTVRIKAADSAVTLNNEVYFLSNQGVVKVSDTGVEIISRAIEPSLLPILSFTSIDSLTYGISYESDKSYLISIPESSSDTAASSTYVYNTFTRCWTRYTYAANCGVYDANSDKLYFGKDSVSSVFRERKSFTNEDYVDPSVSITISAIDLAAKTVTFSIASGTPEAGWVLEQSSVRIVSTAIAASGSNYIATLITAPPATWTTGAALIYPSVGMEVQWDTWTANAPGLIKQVRQAELLADNIPGNNTASSVVMFFETDFDDSNSEVAVTTNSSSWGLSPWGEFPWGGVRDNFGYPTYVPKNAQYCRTMNMGVRFVNGNEKLAIAGIVLTFEGISERTGK